MEDIGQIKFIRRYPVKGMRGEDLEEAQVTASGILGDRVFAFTDDNAPNKKFPWVTSRQAREILLLQPKFLTVPSEVEVLDTKGRKHSVRDREFEKFLEESYGYELTLKYDSGGCFDSKPISLFGIDTLHQLGKETTVSLDHRRFRANFYVQWKCGKPFYEDELIGQKLQLGTKTKVEIVKKDSRCVVPTLDPGTSNALPFLLTIIRTNHRGCAGVYATVIEEGNVGMRDLIYLL
jgi:uncharacterized protein